MNKPRQGSAVGTSLSQPLSYLSAMSSLSSRAQSAPASLNLYRIVEEALANVRMHSGARSVRIVLEPHSDNEVALIVDDDGHGVDTDPSRPLGLGTVGMKERAMFLGGVLRILSDAGSGTKVQAVFPRGQLIPSRIQ